MKEVRDFAETDITLIFPMPKSGEITFGLDELYELAPDFHTCLPYKISSFIDPELTTLTLAKSKFTLLENPTMRSEDGQTILPKIKLTPESQDESLGQIAIVAFMD